MKRSILVAPVVAAAMLTPAIPAFAADTAPAPQAGITQVSNRQDAERALAAVNARIAELQALPAAQANVPDSEAPKVNYGEEIRKLLDTAFELRTTIESIIAGKVPPVDLATLPARIDLFQTNAQIIQRATHELTNKVDAAHVELGFSMSRAIIRMLNPTSTIAQLDQSKADVLATYAKVSKYPDLKPGDTATIYVKDRLNTKIWQTRVNRDKYLLGKRPAGYKAINTAINHAVGVWMNPATTVQQVDDEVKALDVAYQHALDVDPADGNLRAN